MLYLNLETLNQVFCSWIWCGLKITLILGHTVAVLGHAVAVLSRILLGTDAVYFFIIKRQIGA